MPSGIYKRTEKNNNAKGKHWKVKDISNMKGHTPWNKGLTKETDNRVKQYGISCSKTKKGCIPGNKGKRYKIKDTSKMKKTKNFLGHTHTDETKQKNREWHINNPTRKFRDTSIELKIENELKKLQINYQKQVALCNIANVDFYLPDHNIIIQCDGCYWHNCPIHFPKSNPKRINIDKKQNIDLCKAGFILYRFWEHDINASSKKCINQITF